MEYVRLFVSLRDDPKVIGLSDKAFRAYVNALMWCGERETNGEIPEGLVPDKVAAQLVEAGLWHPEDAGFSVPWAKYQFTKAEMERKRAAGRKGAAGRWKTGDNSARDANRNGSRIASGNAEGNANRITGAMAGTNAEVEEEVLGSELGSEVELGTAVGKPLAADAADPFDAGRWEHLLATLHDHRGWPAKGQGAMTWGYLMKMRQQYGSGVVLSALCDVQLDRVPPLTTAAGYFASVCERFSAAVSA